MGKDVVSAPAPMLPTLVDDLHVRRVLGSFQIEEVSFGKPVVLNRLPSANERVLLQERSAKIKTMLRPALMATEELKNARRALGLLFGGYTSLRNSDVDELLDAYLWVLQKYPLFAILEACQDVVDNRVKGLDPKFAPNSAQMSVFAANHTSRLASEQIKIDKILRAKSTFRPADAPGAKDRVRASLKDFHGRIGALLTDEQRSQAERKLAERHRVIAEWADLGLSPKHNGDGVIISVARARELGLMRAYDEAING